MRKLIVGGWLLAWGVGMGVFPSLVWGEEVQVVNSETGVGSVNVAQVEMVENTTVELSNQAEVDNSVSFSINTGGNEANQNTGDGSVQSGGVSLTMEMVNQGSGNVVDLGSGSGGLIVGANSETGAGSVNEVGVAVSQETGVVVSNQLAVDNQVDVDVGTGDNQASGNTGEGVVLSGEVEVEMGLVTRVGEAVVEMCSGCGLDGEVEGGNSKTGMGSVNTLGVEVSESNKVKVNQGTEVSNQMLVGVDTGDNQAGRNSQGARIETGGVWLSLGVESVLSKAEVVVEGGCCEVEDPGDPGDAGDSGVGGPVDEPALPATSPSGSSASASASASAGGGSSDSGGSSSGSVLGAAVGEMVGAVLPATGSRVWWWWMVGLFLLSMGRYVRLMAGRSPAVVRANG